MVAFPAPILALKIFHAAASIQASGSMRSVSSSKQTSPRSHRCPPRPTMVNSRAGQTTPMTPVHTARRSRQTRQEHGERAMQRMKCTLQQNICMCMRHVASVSITQVIPGAASRAAVREAAAAARVEPSAQRVDRAPARAAMRAAIRGQRQVSGCSCSARGAARSLLRYHPCLSRLALQYGLGRRRWSRLQWESPAEPPVAPAIEPCRRHERARGFGPSQ